MKLIFNFLTNYYNVVIKSKLISNLGKYLV